MTPQERRNPDILKASRKKRIAAGSGMKVEDVNRLLKQHRQMADMMKSLGPGKKGGMGKMASMLGMGGGPMGGIPGGMKMPSPQELAALQRQMGAGAGAPLPKPAASPSPLAKPSPAPSPELFKAPPAPGLGGFKLPGLGGPLSGSGFNPFGKKK
jgi:signal recognition particle subunit SRP54